MSPARSITITCVYENIGATLKARDIILYTRVLLHAASTTDANTRAIYTERVILAEFPKRAYIQRNRITTSALHFAADRERANVQKKKKINKTRLSRACRAQLAQRYACTHNIRTAFTLTPSRPSRTYTPTLTQLRAPETAAAAAAQAYISTYRKRGRSLEKAEEEIK